MKFITACGEYNPTEDTNAAICTMCLHLTAQIGNQGDIPDVR